MVWLGRWGKRLLVIPPIALAIVAFIFVAKNRPPLEVRPETESARALHTIAAPLLEVRPRVIGYGTAEYTRKWRAVSQVAGRLQHIHKELHPGAVITEGDVMVKIDDADYRSAVEELTASIEQKQAEIEQLKRTEANYDKTLAVERNVLEVLAQELKRAEALLAQRAGSQSSIDSKQRAVLAQEQVIQDIGNSKSLIEPQIQALEAGIRQSVAQREQAQRDIDRAEIRAPFTMRIGDVDLEPGQFITANETLFEGYSFSELEIEVQLSMLDLHRLLKKPVHQLPVPGELTMENMRSVFQVDAKVSVSGAGTDAVYDGRFLRVREVIDSKTRMLGLVIGVTNSLSSSNGKLKPPVLEGAFCKVELLGRSIGESIVVPRSAVHGSTVYALDQDNRLVKREIAAEFTQDNYTVVASGLSAGERVIVSDPSPAIVGMLVEPIEDAETADELRNAVANASDDNTSPSR